MCLWEHVYIYVKYTRVTYVKRAELESIFPLTLYFLNSVWFLTTCRNILSFPSLSSEDSKDMAGSDSLVIHNPQYFPPFIYQSRKPWQETYSPLAGQGFSSNIYFQEMLSLCTNIYNIFQPLID